MTEPYKATLTFMLQADDDAQAEEVYRQVVEAVEKVTDLPVEHGRVDRVEEG